MHRTRVLAVAPFANPHVTCIYDALALVPGFDVVRASLVALPEKRVALGWPEMGDRSGWLQPWRSAADAWRIRRELNRADVAILPGPFHLKRLPLDFAQRLLLGKGPILAWSEPFLAYRERSALNLRALSLVARALDSPRVHLLSIGNGAIDDYRAIGVRRWTAWTFGFAVEPTEQRAPPVPEQPLRIAFTGELVERKRVDLLLDALGSPALKDAAWTLTVVGDGPLLSRLEAHARLLGIASKVAFYGVASMPGSRASLSDAHALVLPSRFDGWGAAVNEGLEASCAVVASDSCGSSRLLEHGRTGMVFRSGDPDDLARCLLELVASRERTVAMGEAGHEAVKAWRPGPVAERLAALCVALAAGTDPPRPSSGPLAPLG